MKKAIAVIGCFIVLALSLMPSMAVSAEDSAASDITIFLEDGSVQAGDEIVLPIKIIGDGLYTTEFTIKYDTELFAFIKDSAVKGYSCKEANGYLTASETDKGVIKVVYASSKPTSAGTLCTFKLLAKQGTKGECDLEMNIEHAETYDGKDIAKVNAEGRGCVVTVTPFPFPWARVLAGSALAIVLLVILFFYFRSRIRKIFGTKEKKE